MKPGVVKVKYVKKAGMWCKTHFEGTKQIQEWSMEEPS